MLFKVLTVILAVLLIAETGYVLMHRGTIQRFQPVGGYQGFMALDTGNGRLCSTLPEKNSPSVWKERAEGETDPDLKAALVWIANVPTCWSIR
jgi:hypothetical protein